MNVISDGLSVLHDHWRLIAIILLILLFGQLLIWLALKKIFAERLTSDEYFSLGAAGWMVPVLALAIISFLPGTFQIVRFDVLAGAAALALFAFWMFSLTKNDPSRESKSALLTLVMLLVIFIFLRLVFVSQAILPLYFDSAQHYMIIRNLLRMAEISNTVLSFDLLTTNYYHMGFHLLALFFTSISQAEITDTMLVLGQIILAVTPLSIFFFIKHETQSYSAGIFSVLLAGFGWYMPAHVLDWGKYPALTSLMLIQFVLSMAYLLSRYKHMVTGQRYWALIVIFISGLLASVFAHSRSWVIVGIVLIVWVISAQWKKLPRMLQLLVLATVIGGIIWEIIVIQAHDILYLLFDPYGLKSWPITLSVFFLFGFALKAYPRLTFSAVLAVFLFVISLFVPIAIPGYADLTLLDRPFVEMILYLPLAWIGGLGLAGLQGYLSETKLSPLWNTSTGIFFSGLVVVYALFHYQLYPSDCCTIVGPDDLVAIDWMNKNLPPDARVAISAVELLVLASDSFQGYVGGDAGIWITPLTDKPALPFSNLSDFSQQSTLLALCELNASYLYIGETGQTFDDSQINLHPEWYKALLSMPRAKVYQIVGCT